MKQTRIGQTGRHLNWNWKLSAVLGLLACLGGISRAEVNVVPFRIEETRTMAFHDDKVSRPSSSLKVTLSLVGSGAEACVRYGDLKLEEVVDDEGGSLIPAKNAFNDPAKFKEYSNAFFRKSKFADQTPAAPQVELELAPPKRAATKIARLKGSLSLAEQGAISAFELALTGSGQKAVPIPPEAHVGISATVAAGKNIRSIAIEITGDEAALESVEVVDATGRTISNGMSSLMVNRGPAHKSIQLNQPLDNSMKLVAKVALNRKIVQVPFDLKDVPLP
jgi:hypothetical protein